MLDQKTGEDLTTLPWRRSCWRALKERDGRIPRQVLARLIRLGRRAGGARRDWPAPQEAAAPRARARPSGSWRACSGAAG